MSSHNNNRPAMQWLPLTPEPPRPVFLSLAPVMSPSYPRPRQASIDSSTSASTNSAPASPVAAAKPRSSSLSSTSSNGAGSAPAKRVLKLSPVHWGEHLDEHQQDWHEVVVE